MTAFTSAPLRASSSTHMPPKQNPIAATRCGSTSDLFLTSSYQATARARSRSGSLKTSNHGSAARLGIGTAGANILTTATSINTPTAMKPTGAIAKMIGALVVGVRALPARRWHDAIGLAQSRGRRVVCGILISFQCGPPGNYCDNPDDDRDIRRPSGRRALCRFHRVLLAHQILILLVARAVFDARCEARTGHVLR
jgi:hypothetical protein